MKRRMLIPPVLRRQVWNRDGGCCVICGEGLDANWWECHHRLFRSRGGRNELANLIALHPKCHTAKVHLDSAVAEGPGWAISRFDRRSPSEIPVLYADGRSVLLTNDLEAA